VLEFHPRKIKGKRQYVDVLIAAGAQNAQHVINGANRCGTTVCDLLRFVAQAPNWRRPCNHILGYTITRSVPVVKIDCPVDFLFGLISRFIPGLISGRRNQRWPPS
jgi:hypothetical protein